MPTVIIKLFPELSFTLVAVKTFLSLTNLLFHYGKFIQKIELSYWGQYVVTHLCWDNSVQAT